MLEEHHPLAGEGLGESHGIACGLDEVGMVAEAIDKRRGYGLRRKDGIEACDGKIRSHNPEVAS